MTLPNEIESAQHQDVDSDSWALIAENLFSDVNLKLKTVLSAEQVLAIGMALAFAEEFSIPIIKELCVVLMQLKVSEKAFGRKDMRAVFTSILGFQKGEDMNDIDKLLKK